MATAAVGGSHLVASTQAGAKFGWQLVVLILAVNVLKYPFFRAGVSYTISTRPVSYTHLTLPTTPYV